MAGRVSLDGTEVELQEAIDLLAARLNVVNRQPAEGALMDQLNETLREAAVRSRNRASFDLVSSVAAFDGDKPGTVHDFFQSLERVGSLSNWGEEEKLKIAQLKVTGAALRFIKSVDQARLKTYDEFKAALIERFKEKLPRDCYFQQLSIIQQRPGETPDAFADRVSLLNEKTVRITENEEVNAALRGEGDRRALDAFLRGLVGSVGEQTRLKFPTTLREAVSMASAIEQLLHRHGDTTGAMKGPPERKVYQADASYGGDRPKERSTQGYRSFTPDRKRDRRYDSNRDENYDRWRYDRRDEPLDRRDSNLQNRRYDERGAQPHSKWAHPMSEDRKRDPPICWRCSRRGHLQAQCRVRIPTGNNGRGTYRGKRGWQERRRSAPTINNYKPTPGGKSKINIVRMVPIVRDLAEELVAIGRLGHMEGKVLVDTGAQVSLLKRGASDAPMRRLDVVIKGISGRELKAYGRQHANIELKPGATIRGDFVVCNLPKGYLAVLGCDIMKEGKSNINIPSGTLEIFGQKVWLNRLLKNESVPDP